MKASELRIGNYVCLLADDPETYQEVISVTQDLTDNEFINPIPLTDEWLKRLGFVMTIFHNEEYDVDFEEWEYDPKHKDEYLLFDLTYCNGSLDIDDKSTGNISYVHEVQNLYHALTGYELKVNL